MSNSDFTSVFNLYDSDGDGRVNTVEASHIIRTLGYKVSNTQLEQLYNNTSIIKNNQSLSMSDIQSILPYINNSNTEQDLLDAISVFDKDNTGYIPASQLYNVLTSLGEPISQNELEILTSQIKTDDNGRVKLTDFVKLIYSK